MPGRSPTRAGTAAASSASEDLSTAGGADPEAFLESLPTAQLEAMLGDDEALKKAAAQWLKDLPAARALEDVRRQNRSVATANVALGRSIEEARGHVAIVRSGEYAAMRALFEELYARQEAVIAKMGPGVLLAKVREEADKADAASDELLERFQAGTLSVEAFVDAYVAAREAFHTVDLKRQAAEHHMLA
ncbi:hypothetical protein GPECTOR_33g662 [Gonium pectorale]|uniref:VPS37 C-terminal domain-containing protein n=1 Tax=Gonium pectorale TaxID=33097 RepID=A0A150GEK7_GONPE|nr:hypothetical protein GPECTOR_33g662 [Gonium pectorale]|eukprot:KXZ47780.1 hypothetical protein GPECTOR_33g662 [Gonium pectorale]